MSRSTGRDRTPDLRTSRTTYSHSHSHSHSYSCSRSRSRSRSRSCSCSCSCSCSPPCREEGARTRSISPTRQMAIARFLRARKPKRLPVPMTREEANVAVGHLEGDKWPTASLMYGAGLRLMDCVRDRGCAGGFWTQGREDDDDLHACAQSRRQGRS